MFRVQDRCIWLGERKGKVPDWMFWKARGTGALGLPLWAYALLEGERQKSEVISG